MMQSNAWARGDAQPNLENLGNVNGIALTLPLRFPYR